MAKVVVKSKVKKVKRKFPVEIKAPEIFNSISLGKANVTDLNSLIGKQIKINLMYVTNNIRNQNIRLIFKIEEVHAGVAKTQIVSCQQIPYYLNRFVKKGSDLITDSFECISKDNKVVRVKPFIVTKQNTSMNVLNSIREKVKELVEKDVKSKPAEVFIADVTGGKIQLGYRNEVKKIFPLKAFEFKHVIINKNK
jgi:ribosomal protein S3AE